MYGYGWMWPMGGAMVGWLLATVLVIGLTVWLVTRYTSPNNAADASATARRILAERYARGELNTDEYAHRLAELRE
jgi:putative membrane protein